MKRLISCCLLLISLLSFSQTTIDVDKNDKRLTARGRICDQLL
ncbi:MAG TPA: hypothetical protein VHQ93_07470 [Chitinophagaceae bacterium]|nr:hypothetical protein [Chitinophagaceae bacterium]